MANKKKHSRLKWLLPLPLLLLLFLGNRFGLGLPGWDFGTGTEPGQVQETGTDAEDSGSTDPLPEAVEPEEIEEPVETDGGGGTAPSEGDAEATERSVDLTISEGTMTLDGREVLLEDLAGALEAFPQEEYIVYLVDDWALNSLFVEVDALLQEKGYRVIIRQMAE
ncbi:hypothetical protein [Anaerotalea alkaliphila]|uniref:Uncharacterized protein n=1 Tax=Anaerotalea alkaliphila TaxID=2662126 RepID=A0A7X5KMN8_9FIRM|nr:hypothetical protein [Anaerotalea alkaliphila]NDL67154.1 hypothetical protein [Anaerotalea alkaliphila]